MVFLFCKPSLQFKLQQLSFHRLGPKSYVKNRKNTKKCSTPPPAQLVSRYYKLPFRKARHFLDNRFDAVWSWQNLLCQPTVDKKFIKYSGKNQIVILTPPPPPLTPLPHSYFTSPLLIADTISVVLSHNS